MIMIPKFRFSNNQSLPCVIVNVLVFVFNFFPTFNYINNGYLMEVKLFLSGTYLLRAQACLDSKGLGFGLVCGLLVSG
jgi:hypothetical protein